MNKIIFDEIEVDNIVIQLYYDKNIPKKIDENPESFKQFIYVKDVYQ